MVQLERQPSEGISSQFGLLSLVYISVIININNDPEIALSSLKEVLKEKNINNPDIIVATQEERTELIEV